MLKVLERLSFMLSGARLGITVTGLVVGLIAEPSVSALLKQAPKNLAIAVPERLAKARAPFMTAVLLSGVSTPGVGQDVGSRP